MTINAYAAGEARGSLSSFQYEPEPLGPNDVELKISHCGICHSDLHLIDDDWACSRYPLVPGHEIIGTITAAGDAVRHVEVGQRVGVGWQRSACLSCELCLRGLDNHCPSKKATCVAGHGGFADGIRIDSRYTFPIPEALDSAATAPLLCAGITVYSPLRRHGIGAHSRVGVIGIGGLGHLGVRFAAAMGSEVTAFSTSDDKEGLAKSLGATHFVNSKNARQMELAKNKLDFIISTVHVDLDWEAYMGILRIYGKLCFVGVPGKKIAIAVDPFIDGLKSVCGSAIGSRAGITEMLDLAARHDIRAQVETMPIQKVNDAVGKVRDNKARFRMVLEVGG